MSQVAVPVYATDQARASPRPYAAARVERQEFERDYERAGAGEEGGAYYGYGGYPTSPPTAPSGYDAPGADTCSPACAGASAAGTPETA